MLKTVPSIVLASLGPSTVPQGYASGSTLAAALLENRFEHPSAKR